VDTSIITPEVDEDAMGLTDTHEQVVLLYRQRLAHLLQQQPTDDALLSHAEQRQLLSRSVMTTIETLTQMGDGAMASRFLRQARRRS
jgi:hypothetical protein